jgi:hypothetical protein
MGKTFYQPVVIKIAKDMISIFRECDFFIENKIESEDYAMEYMCNVLTQKFIAGQLNEELDEGIFTEDEIAKYLKEIVAYNILTSLKNKGLFDSIEDENNEEGFFLTELGKNVRDKLKLQRS